MSEFFKPDDFYDIDPGIFITAWAAAAAANSLLRKRGKVVYSLKHHEVWRGLKFETSDSNMDQALLVCVEPLAEKQDTAEMLLRDLLGIETQFKSQRVFSGPQLEKVIDRAKKLLEKNS